MIHFKPKIAIFGDSEIGKTTLVRSYIDQNCIKMTEATIGMSYFSLKYKNMSISCIDISGNTLYKYIYAACVKKTDTAILCYHSGNRETFLSLKEWYAFIRQTCGSFMRILIVGLTWTGCEKQISASEVHELAQELKVSWKEINIFDIKQVSELFNSECELLYHKYEYKRIQWVDEDKSRCCIY
jgi:GTPase SAR1 family protein